MISLQDVGEDGADDADARPSKSVNRSRVKHQSTVSQSRSNAGHNGRHRMSRDEAIKGHSSNRGVRGYDIGRGDDIGGNAYDGRYGDGDNQKSIARRLVGGSSGRVSHRGGDSRFSRRPGSVRGSGVGDRVGRSGGRETGIIVGASGYPTYSEYGESSAEAEEEEAQNRNRNRECHHQQQQRGRRHQQHHQHRQQQHRLQPKISGSERKDHTAR